MLGKIKEFGIKEALRVKEEVDREVLHQWAAERLDAIGCRRVEKDTFWYEIDEQKFEDKS